MDTWPEPGGPVIPLSDRSRQVLPQHARVPRGNSQQRQRWPLGASSTLLPIAERVNADTECVGELLLSQADKASKRDDIITSSQFSAEDALALFPRYCTGEVPVGQFTNLIFHVSHLQIFRSVDALSW